MLETKLLPDAEFDVMQVVWGAELPISSVQVYSASAEQKGWKPQTVLTLLTRLEKKGFVRSEKRGKERYYWPLVSREQYLQQETGQFIERYHGNSVKGLMAALFGGKKPKASDLNELEAWLAEQANGDE